MVLRTCFTVAAVAAGAVAACGPASAYGCGHRSSECYEKVRRPDVYTTVARPVVVRPGYREVVETPPVVATRTERVVITPGHTIVRRDPPVYASRVDRVLVRPERVTYVRTPATRRIVRQNVVVHPGGYTWEHRRGAFGREKLCKVRRGPVIKTIAREVIEPGHRVARVLPALYQTVERPVLVHPGRTRHYYQPPVEAFVDRPVLLRPASRHVIAHPPVVAVQHERVLVRHGGYGWQRSHSDW